MPYARDEGWTRCEKVSVTLVILLVMSFIALGWVSAKREIAPERTTQDESHCLGCGS